MFPRKQFHPRKNFTLVIIVGKNENPENASPRVNSHQVLKSVWRYQKHYSYEKQTKSQIKKKLNIKARTKEMITVIIL